MPLNNFRGFHAEDFDGIREFERDIRSVGSRENLGPRNAH